MLLLLLQTQFEGCRCDSSVQEKIQCLNEILYHVLCYISPRLSKFEVPKINSIPECHIFTESPNHQMAEVGTHVQKSFSPIPEPCPVVNIFKGGGSTISLHSVFQCLITFTVKKNKKSYIFQLVRPIFHLLLVATEKNRASSPSFFSSVRYLYIDFIQEVATITKARTEVDILIHFHYVT